jgi:ferredoxin
MRKRKIVRIDEKKCNGCGKCIPNCQEGALRIIDGKARLISDLFCDGLGACIGHCPRGAITIEDRKAEDYDEKEVLEKNIIPKGRNTLKAHLNHLKEHNAEKYFKQAIAFLKEKGVENPLNHKIHQGCPGSRMIDMHSDKDSIPRTSNSQLRQWPIQLHLVSPDAPYFQGKDLLIAADCTAFALGSFQTFLKDKSLIIGCPKLDNDQEIYQEKLNSIINQSKNVTVLTMEVPCCSGLLQLAVNARGNKRISIRALTVGINGNILKEENV